MYRIKQAALRAGVSVELLRAWERRYGVVHPARTEAGYRVYDETAIARLRAMRHLMDEGWAASAAAAAIIEATDQRVRELSGTAGPGAGVADGPAPPRSSDQRAARSESGAGPREDLVGRFVTAAGALDAAEVEAILDEMFARGSFEFVVERLVSPALRGVGSVWASGNTDIAAEHAATHAVLRRFSAAYQAAGSSGHGAPVLVGLPPGSRHELGILAFAVASRRAGVPVLYLGTDLPVDEWVRTASSIGARAAVVGVPTSADPAPAKTVVDALRATQPELLIALGGSAAHNVEPVEGDDRIIRLPATLTEAVEALRAALRRTGGATM